jgi:hypothetical protein
MGGIKKRITMKDTGRFFVKDHKSGRVFCVEPINENPHNNWGDVNPVTNKVEGDYGKKHVGSVKRNESIITPENGFKNIIELEIGKNPLDYINKVLNTKYPLGTKVIIRNNVDDFPNLAGKKVTITNYKYWDGDNEGAYELDGGGNGIFLNEDFEKVFINE